MIIHGWGVELTLIQREPLPGMFVSLLHTLHRILCSSCLCGIMHWFLVVSLEVVGDLVTHGDCALTCTGVTGLAHADDRLDDDFA